MATVINMHKKHFRTVYRLITTKYKQKENSNTIFNLTINLTILAAMMHLAGE